MDGVAFPELDGGLIGVVGVSDEASEVGSLVFRVFDELGEAEGAGAGADDDDFVGSAELAADVAHEWGGVEAEEAEEDPGEKGEAGEEGAAEVEAEEEFEEDDGDEAEDGLAGGFADDGPRVGFLVDVEPESGGGPDEGRKAEEESVDGGREFEVAGEGEVEAGLISGFESEGDKEDVGKGEEAAHLAMVTGEHLSRVSIA